MFTSNIYIDIYILFIYFISMKVFISSSEIVRGAKNDFHHPRYQEIKKKVSQSHVESFMCLRKSFFVLFFKTNPGAKKTPTIILIIRVPLGATYSVVQGQKKSNEIKDIQYYEHLKKKKGFLITCNTQTTKKQCSTSTFGS